MSKVVRWWTTPRRPRIRNAFGPIEAKPAPSVIAMMKIALTRETVAKTHDLPLCRLFVMKYAVPNQNADRHGG